MIGHFVLASTCVAERWKGSNHCVFVLLVLASCRLTYPTHLLVQFTALALLAEWAKYVWQMMMAVFSYLYYYNFVYEAELDVGSVLSMAVKLENQQKIEVFVELGRILLGEQLIPGKCHCFHLGLLNQWHSDTNAMSNFCICCFLIVLHIVHDSKRYGISTSVMGRATLISLMVSV